MLTLHMRRSNSCTVFSQIANRTSRPTLPPLKGEVRKCDSSEAEPNADDIDTTKTIYSINPVKKKYHSNQSFPTLPPIGTLDSSKYELLMEKLKLCSILCDFVDPEADLRAKQIKTNTINEIINTFGTNSSAIKSLPPLVAEILFEMFTVNLIRPILPISHVYSYYGEPIITDIAWPHVSLVYQLLEKYQTGNPTDSHFHSLAESIFLNLQAPDLGERNFVVNFLTLYLRTFPDKKGLFFTKCRFYIQQFLDDEFDIFCINPILQLILNFSYVDKQYILSTVAPLVAGRHFTSYSNTVQAVFSQAIQSDHTIIVGLLHSLLNHWPSANPYSEIAFIKCLVLILSQMEISEIEENSSLIFPILAVESGSTSAKVAEAAMSIWSDVSVIPKLIDTATIALPILYPPINDAMKWHWSKVTQSRALTALKSMHDADPLVFDELSRKPQQKAKENSPTDPPPKHRVWSSIAREAAKTDRNIQLNKLLITIQKTFPAPKKPIKITASQPMQKRLF